MRQPTPPALPGLPILGNLLEFNRDRYGLLQRGYDTLGPIFSLRLGPKRAAVLIGPHYHQRFFEETDHTLSIAQAYKFLVTMFGEPVGVMDPGRLPGAAAHFARAVQERQHGRLCPGHGPGGPGLARDAGSERHL